MISLVSRQNLNLMHVSVSKLASSGVYLNFRFGCVPKALRIFLLIIQVVSVINVESEMPDQPCAKTTIDATVFEIITGRVSSPNYPPKCSMFSFFLSF